MPPGKIEFSPLTGANPDDDDDSYSKLSQVPVKAIKQFKKSDELSNAEVDVVDFSKKKTEPTYFGLLKDDDEENQYYDENNDDPKRTKGNTILVTTLTPTDLDKLSDSGDGDANVDENSNTKERLIILLTQAGPVTASFFLGFAGTFTNLIFASHFIGDDGAKSTVFAGVSLANMFANVSCMSLLIGTMYGRWYRFLMLKTSCVLDASYSSSQ